ncbi:hypothetical protein DIPPA_04986 [Diplonema papillatum]|nr:hypothetical protein DIPPA_04986 [Diplonema papillatum]
MQCDSSPTLSRVRRFGNGLVACALDSPKRSRNEEASPQFVRSHRGGSRSQSPSKAGCEAAQLHYDRRSAETAAIREMKRHFRTLERDPSLRSPPAAECGGKRSRCCEPAAAPDKPEGGGKKRKGKKRTVEAARPPPPPPDGRREQTPGKGPAGTHAPSSFEAHRLSPPPLPGEPSDTGRQRRGNPRTTEPAKSTRSADRQAEGPAARGTGLSQPFGADRDVSTGRPCEPPDTGRERRNGKPLMTEPDVSQRERLAARSNAGFQPFDADCDGGRGVLKGGQRGAAGDALRGSDYDEKQALEEQVRALTEANDRLFDTCNELHAAVGQRERRVAFELGAQRQLKEENAGLRRERAALQATVKDLRGKAEGLEADVSRMAAEVKRLRAEAEERDQDEVALESKLKAVAEAAAKGERHIKKLSRQVDALRADANVDSVRQAERQAACALHAMQCVIDVERALEAKNASLRDEVAALRHGKTAHLLATPPCSGSRKEMSTPKRP